MILFQKSESSLEWQVLLAAQWLANFRIYVQAHWSEGGHCKQLKASFKKEGKLS
jgi:hypothetical protein